VSTHFYLLREDAGGDPLGEVERRVRAAYPQQPTPRELEVLWNGLTPGQRCAFLVRRFQSDFDRGGLFGFLHGDHGLLLGDVVRAFEWLEAKRAARLLGRVRRAFPEERLPWRTEERQRLLLSPSLRARIARVDRAIQADQQNDPWQQRLERYFTANPAEFFYAE
jgi:hypothetical protein